MGSEVIIPGESQGFQDAIAFFDAQDSATRGETPQQTPKQDQDQAKKADEKTSPAPSEGEQTQPDAIDQDADQTDEEGEQKSEEKKPDEKPNRLEKRFRQMTEQRRRLENENFDLRQRVSALEQKQNQPQPAPVKPGPKQAAGEPKIEDFDDFGSYTKAVARYEREEAERESQAKNAEKAQKDKLVQVVQAFETKQKEASKNPEYVEFVIENDDLVISKPLALIASQSENFTDVAIWLGKNPKESERISKLPPHLMAKEIGKIEYRLEIEKSKPENKEIKEPTKVAKPGTGIQRPFTREQSTKMIREAKTLDDYARIVDKLKI